MMRVQTTVQLTEELVAKLDREAARRGVSRSALIRDVLVRSLADGSEEEIDRQIVEGYTRIPSGTFDRWGDPEAFADAAAVDTMRRLGAEERRSVDRRRSS